MLTRVKYKESFNSRPMFQLGLMMILTIFTQVIMLLKTSVIASSFGASVEMDAFNFANSIGNFMYSFIGAGITTVLIPNLINNKKKEAINIFISVLYSVGFIILLLVHMLRGTLVKGLSSGSEEFVLITCNIMFITLITQYINSFTGTTNAIFQCSGKFNFPKFVNLLVSSVLVVLVLLEKDLTIYKYSLIILITTIINVAIQIYLAISGGYKFKFKLDLRNKEFIKMIKVFAPTVLSTGLYQITLLTDSIISSNLGEGDISKLSYSNNIMTLVNTIILGNIMTYFYPKIAKDIKKEDGQKRLFDLSIIINAIMILMVVGFCIVGKDGIAILYERGKFTSNITTIVYICTLIYMIGLPTNAFRDLIYRYFYANEDTITPFKNSLIISLINIFISIVLAYFMGIYGVIIGTVISSYISLSMILLRFSEKFKFKYSIRYLIVENIKLIISAIITIYLVVFIRGVLPKFNVMVSFLVYGSISVVLYVILMSILKSSVLKDKLNY